MSKVNYQTLNLIYDGSQKFTYASFLLKDEVSMGVAYIFRWIDYCREAIEDRHFNETVDSLKNKTKSIPAQSPLSPPFESLKRVMRKYGIPFHYPLEHLEGLRTKFETRSIESQRELELYCYRMKSTLGLMVSQVMGITNQLALESIKNLGIGIELIYIANHLKQDLKNNICLIPQDLINQYGPDLNDKEVQYQLACHLIRRAFHYLDLSLAGIEHLPFRSGLLILSLIKLNQEIGKKVMRRGHVKKPVRLSQTKKFSIFIKCILIHSRQSLSQKINHSQELEFPKTTKFESV